MRKLFIMTALGFAFFTGAATAIVGPPSTRKTRPLGVARCRALTRFLLGSYLTRPCTHKFDMFAYPSKADIGGDRANVSFVPIADISRTRVLARAVRALAGATLAVDLSRTLTC